MIYELMHLLTFMFVCEIYVGEIYVGNVGETTPNRQNNDNNNNKNINNNNNINNKRREDLGNSALIGTSSWPYVNICVVRLRGLLMLLDIILILFNSPHCTPLNICPIRKNM